MIEVGVFIDDALWNHFENLYPNRADIELEAFTAAVISNIDSVFRHPTLQPSLQIKLTHYEVLKTLPSVLSRTLHDNGDAIKLLDIFCEYQSTINGNRSWDHALLLTGYDLYRENVSAVAGYAPVNGMCTRKRSCTIGEGHDFGAVFILAHEMGHSLGMQHDGDNQCDSSCCIMSPAVGTGRTLWSNCSVRELNAFIKRLDETDKVHNCLRTIDGTRRSWQVGRVYTPDEQCMMFHGDCWRHELKHGQTSGDICAMLWCGNGEGIVRSAHPALQYTYCGVGMWCIHGKCSSTGTMTQSASMDGSWSEWNEFSRGSCSSECQTCQIQQQIRLRRSTRLCTKPFPRNGGKYCEGDDTRGILCQQEMCSGIMVKDYASQQCAKLRDNGDRSTRMLTGLGMQYSGDMCKIWCLMPANQIRTISHFPDGTPCGPDQYCIKGRCRSLMCNGRAVVEKSDDCPSRTMGPQNHMHSQFVSTKNSIKTPIAALNVWSAWSVWSQCSSKTCAAEGFRIRQRECATGKLCPGTRQQLSICKGICKSSTGL